MDNQSKFRELFLKFEEETKKKTNYKYEYLSDCISELKESGYNPYKKEASFIEFCRRLRNINFHNKNDNYYLITDDTISKFEKVLDEVLHPIKVSEKATKNIYSNDINDKVLDAMKKMNEKSYTHIPIYDGNSVVGIFSENSLFQYVMEDGIIEINDETTFNDIRQCIDLNKSKEIVKFISENKLYDDVVNDFINEFKHNNRLACVMITHSGKTTEKVIGILTAWDIIGR